MVDPRNYHFDLLAANRPDLFKLEEEYFPNIKSSWKRSTSTRLFNPITGIKAVVIHATAGSSSAGAASVMFAGKASFHWLVPDEDELEHGKFAWACAPESLAAWHVRNAVSHPKVNKGANKVNHWSLGIEIVNSQKSSDGFSEWQVYMTARIVRYCWAKYPNLEHVVSHAMLDPTRRTDPGTNFPWAAFENEVLNAGTSAASSPAAGAVGGAGVSAVGCCTG